jgi:hypothetical protein
LIVDLIELKDAYRISKTHFWVSVRAFAEVMGTKRGKIFSECEWHHQTGWGRDGTKVKKEEAREPRHPLSISRSPPPCHEVPPCLGPTAVEPATHELKPLNP